VQLRQSTKITGESSTDTCRSNSAFEHLMFFLGMSVASFCLLWQISEFPIFFFCDEATMGVIARAWTSNSWRDSTGTLFPMYHQVAPMRWIPMLGSYISALSSEIFGLSVVVARSTNAVFTLLGMIATSLIAKQILSLRHWWLVPVAFPNIASWFLHGRTAFYNLPTASFLALFILFYLHYRSRNKPLDIYIAVIAAACCFYTYSSSQVVVPLIAIAVLLVDFRYHARNWRRALLASTLAGILLLPAINFSLSDISPFHDQLKALDSYALKTASLSEKTLAFTSRYLESFSPNFWLSATSEPNIRHRVANHAHFPLFLAPFLLVGLLLTLGRLRRPEYRLIFLCSLLIPIPAALSDPTISRLLMLLVPFSLWSLLGFEWILTRIRAPLLVPLACWIALSANGVGICLDSVRNGKFWFNDYSLYGLQFGAKELFGENIPQYLLKNPDRTLTVSPHWANDPSPLVPFFLSPNQAQRIRLEGPDFHRMMSIARNERFVITPQEFQAAQQSGKFKQIEVEQIIFYPDGNPGFYFVRLDYLENASELFAVDRLKRQELATSYVRVLDQDIEVRHSQLDMGSVAQMFDGNPDTVGRGLEANPFRLELTFPRIVVLKEVLANLRSILAIWTLTIFDEDAQRWVEFRRDLDASRGEGMQPFGLEQPIRTRQIKMAIKNSQAGEFEHIHIWELSLNVEN
jgi:hypothetical protein